MIVVDDVVRWLGLRTISSSEAEVLTDIVETANAAIDARLMPVAVAPPVDPVIEAEVDQGKLLYAARLWKRRNSPEGVAGFGEFGVVRVAQLDPDVERLIGRYLLLDGFA